MAKKTVEERFWLKVNKNGPIHLKYGRCWEWTGSRFKTGFRYIKADAMLAERERSLASASSQ